MSHTLEHELEQRAAAGDGLVRGRAPIDDGTIYGGTTPEERRRMSLDQLVFGPSRIRDGVVEAPPEFITVTGGTTVRNVNDIYPSDEPGVRRSTPSETESDVTKVTDAAGNAAEDAIKSVQFESPDLSFLTGPALLIGGIVAALVALNAFARGAGRGAVS